MKFLCVACDEQMSLERTLPPDNNAISVVFTCPSCGNAFTMHTNSMETQLVRSLDVKIGGADTARAPMQTVRESLTGAKGIVDESTESASSGSKCPFTGTVADAYADQKTDSGPRWTEAAEARMERVPSFIRPMVRKGIEDVAKQKGYSEITEEVMAAVRSEIGM